MPSPNVQLYEDTPAAGLEAAASKAQTFEAHLYETAAPTIVGITGATGGAAGGVTEPIHAV